MPGISAVTAIKLAPDNSKLHRHADSRSGSRVLPV
jgi:hypothetical protein